ncbi:terminase [Phreatobacter stygius]|uniref:Terminase n=1 Tax=Phreatobacter stygius TaxID=1940610 RepID=A0A4D7B8G6_9HYPH|nr:terminase [Phreatobacter stygius]
MTETERRPVGGQPKYQIDFARQAAKLCALGATDADLAEFFAVHICTINRWKVAHEAFWRALKLGKGAVDDMVERSLYQRAVGFSYDTIKIFTHQGQVIRAEHREYYPPDTAAAIFWLKTRRPEEWREKLDVNHSGNLTVELVKFSDDPES